MRRRHAGCEAWDDGLHRKLTGMGSQMVIDNAVKLAKAGKLEEIRTVVVPGYLDSEQTVTEITRASGPLLGNGLHPLQDHRPTAPLASGNPFAANCGSPPPMNFSIWRISPDATALPTLC